MFLGRGSVNNFDITGVIELSLILEFSQNLSFVVKMITIAPHYWYVLPSLAFYISFGVGYCFYPLRRAMREA